MAILVAALCLWALFNGGTGAAEHKTNSFSKSRRHSMAGNIQLAKPDSFSRPQISEVQLGHIRHWTREVLNPSSPADLLVLVLTSDETSWGKIREDADSRTIDSFVELLSQTQFAFERLSVALLTSSHSQFSAIKTALRYATFQKSQVIHHLRNGTLQSRTERHADGIQLERRRSIARLRNYLMLRALRDEDHVVWLDADVHWLSPGIIQKMIQQSLWTPSISRKVGIITARCTFGQNPNYDRNAWVGPRTNPGSFQGHSMAETFVPSPTAETQFMDQLVEETTDDDLIPLDSVGGTILYISSDVIRQGVIFPTYRAVGTAWNSLEGWDGIETEGVCYIAKSLGYGCYGLGGHWVVKHTQS